MSVIIYIFIGSIILGITLIGFDIYKYLKTKDFNWKRLFSSSILIISFIMLLLVSRDLFLILENTKKYTKIMNKNYEYSLKMKEKYKYCTKGPYQLIPLTGNKYDDIVYENINLIRKVNAAQTLCDENENLSDYLTDTELKKIKSFLKEIKKTNEENRKKLLFL